MNYKFNTVIEKTEKSFIPRLRNECFNALKWRIFRVVNKRRQLGRFLFSRSLPGANRRTSRSNPFNNALSPLGRP